MKGGGYGSLPNCLPDIYMRAVSDVQYKILECISRKTLGWHERWDAIPLSQFEDMMGNSRPAIVRAITELRKLKIILCGKGQGRSASQYALNPGFDTFELMVKHFNQLSKLTSNTELLLVVKQINCYAAVVVNEINTPKTVPKNSLKTSPPTPLNVSTKQVSSETEEAGGGNGGGIFATSEKTEKEFGRIKRELSCRQVRDPNLSRIAKEYDTRYLERHVLQMDRDHLDKKQNQFENPGAVLVARIKSNYPTPDYPE